MENKTIRKEALNWLRSRFQIDNDEIYASKFYSPIESWSKTRVWFFQIPLEVVYSPIAKKIHRFFGDLSRWRGRQQGGSKGRKTTDSLG